ncbi:MAG: YezD family protein [Methylotenera sp.]
MSVTKSKFSLETDEAVLQAVALAISSVKQQSGYGSIEITVHDGRVTQIERREKVRFDHKVIVTKT